MSSSFNWVEDGEVLRLNDLTAAQEKTLRTVVENGGGLIWMRLGCRAKVSNALLRDLFRQVDLWTTAKGYHSRATLPADLGVINWENATIIPSTPQ